MLHRIQHRVFCTFLVHYLIKFYSIALREISWQTRQGNTSKYSFTRNSFWFYAYLEWSGNVRIQFLVLFLIFVKSVRITYCVFIGPIILKYVSKNIQNLFSKITVCSCYLIWFDLWQVRISENWWLLKLTFSGKFLQIYCIIKFV